MNRESRLTSTDVAWVIYLSFLAHPFLKNTTRRTLATILIAALTHNSDLISSPTDGTGIEKTAETTASSADNSSTSRESLITRYTLALREQKRSPNTIKNYISDVDTFLSFYDALPLSAILTKPNTSAYAHLLEKSGLSRPTIERKMSAIRGFAHWAAAKGFIHTDPFPSEALQSSRGLLPGFHISASYKSSPQAASNNNQAANIKAQLVRVYERYHSYPLTSYLHLSILVVAAMAMGFLGYTQIMSNTKTSLAFPTALNRPNRTLSFQARLTDAASTPITTTTAATFKLWTLSSGGSQLWTSGSCSITPDSNGIFSTLLGSNCGSEITSDVFSENANVWLEITVGAETLTPRQQIATVGYALNSETLQGYPASASAMPNTVPVMDNTGTIVLGWGASTIQSTLGTFAIKGNALTLSTNTSTNGNIQFAPDGTGQVKVLGGTTTTDTFSVNNASLTSGNLITGSVANSAVGYKLISLQSGSSPTEKFSVDALGNVTEKGYFSAPGATISATYSGATPLIVNGTGGQIFSIANSGNIAATGTITGLTGITSSGTIQFSSLTTNGGVVWTNGSGTLATSAAGSANQCLVSNGAAAPSWSTCASGTNNVWQLNTQVISPGNSTYDLAIGGTATTSAKFQIFGNTGNATTSGTFTFAGTNANNLIAARNKAGITIGDSQTGNIIFNGGNIGIGTTNPSSKLNLVGSSATGDLNVSTTSNAASISMATLTAPSATGDVYFSVGKALSSTNTALIGLSNTGSASNYAFLTTYGRPASDFIVSSLGRVGIGTTTPTSLFSVGSSSQFQVNSSGAIAAAAGITSSGSITFSALNTNGGVVWTNGSGTLATSAAGSANQCLISNGAAAPSWVACASGTSNVWQLNSPVISPANSTYDMAVGGTATASAKFLVQGTTGFTTIGTGLTAQAPLYISSGFGANAAMIVNNLNSGDLFAASSSGTTRFRIDNSGNAIAATFQDSANTAYYLDPANAGVSLAVAGDATAGGKLIIGGTSGIIQPADGPLTLNYKSGPNAWTAGLTMNTVGNIGIGTTNPTQKLEVFGGTPQVLINGTGSNMLRFGEPLNSIYAAPAFTTRSIGTRIVYYPQIDGTNLDYASGVENLSLWQTIPQASSAYAYKWYGGTTELMKLRGDGLLTVTGDIQIAGGNRRLSLGDMTTANTGVYFNTITDTNYFIGRDSTAWGAGQPLTYNSFYGHTFTYAGNIQALKIDPAGIVTIGSGQAATSSALVQNTDTGTDADGLAIKLGFTASVGGSCNSGGACNEFVTFMNGDGLKLGKIYASAASGANTVTYKTNGNDMAEYFKKQPGTTFEPGDIVSMDTNGATKPARESDSKILGIVTTTPGFVGGDDDGNSVLVALVGQVPLKIDPTSAPISKGDFLTSSEMTGMAKKATGPGYVIGKALEEWDPAIGKNKINTFIHVGYMDPDRTLDAALSLDGLVSFADVMDPSAPYSLMDTAGTQIHHVVRASHAAIANLTAGFIRTKQLVADSIQVGGVTLEQYIKNVVQTMPQQQGNSIAKTIDPQTGIENLMIMLGGEATSSAKATLKITDRALKTVASIDEGGNASFAGTLQATNLQVNDASIAGVLYATQIDGLKEKVASLVSGEIASTSAELMASLAGNNASILDRVALLEHTAQPIASGSSLLSTDALMASDSIIVGNTLTLTGSTFGTSEPTLSLQPSGMGRIDILAGAMTLDATSGLAVSVNTVFAKNVTVLEDLITSSIKPTENLTVQFATNSGSLNNRLAIQDQAGVETSSINSRGEASFNKLIIASDNTVSTASISGELHTNATTGGAVLPVGATAFTIISTQITANSRIYVTPTSSTNNQVLYVASVQGATNAQEGSATIAIDAALSVPLSFNWWIIN